MALLGSALLCRVQLQLNVGHTVSYYLIAVWYIPDGSSNADLKLMLFSCSKLHVFSSFWGLLVTSAVAHRRLECRNIGGSVCIDFSARKVLFMRIS